MKIGALNLKPVVRPFSPVEKQPKAAFKAQYDSFDFSGNFIKSVNDREPPLIELNRPMQLEELFLMIVKSQNPALEKIFLRKAFDKATLSGYMTDFLYFPKEISNMKIKNLYDLGCFALVFETQDGKILKIGEGSHFPEDRKPEDFDVPVEKSGKGRFLHYYVEQKCSVDDVSEEEILDLCKYIKSKGFLLIDVNLMNGSLKKEQFGMGKDGKIYLLDPQCAIKRSIC